MKYTAKFFRDSYPEWKRKKDWWPTRYFYRQLSFPLSAFFSNVGWTANMVSYFSALIGLAACTCFALGHPIVGAVIVNVWLVFDCADGNIARSVKKERYGDFADSMSSYLCVGFLFASIGMCVYQTGGLLLAVGNPWVIYMGALAGSSDSLMRLLYQKYLNSTWEQGVNASHSNDPQKESGINRLRMKVDGYLSLGGSIPIALIITSILGWLDLVVVIWLCYYGLTLVATSLYLMHKTFKANAEVGDGDAD